MRDLSKRGKDCRFGEVWSPHRSISGVCKTVSRDCLESPAGRRSGVQPGEDNDSKGTILCASRYHRSTLEGSTTTFQTVSLGRWVNKGKRKGRGCLRGRDASTLYLRQQGVRRGLLPTGTEQVRTLHSPSPLSTAHDTLSTQVPSRCVLRSSPKIVHTGDAFSTRCLLPWWR
jgi:hypothetical protein